MGSLYLAASHRLNPFTFLYSVSNVFYILGVQPAATLVSLQS